MPTGYSAEGNWGRWGNRRDERTLGSGGKSDDGEKEKERKENERFSQIQAK